MFFLTKNYDRDYLSEANRLKAFAGYESDLIAKCNFSITINVISSDYFELDTCVNQV